MIIGATGHRPQTIGGFNIPNPIYNFIVKNIYNILTKQLPEKVNTGMALGVDTWIAEICLELKIPYTAVVPFKGQESKWPIHSQQKYFDLLDKADTVEYVSEPGYSKQKMHTRNKWIVDNSDKMIAVWDGRTNGGTFNCVSYARKTHKEVIIINPQDYNKQY